MAVEVTVRITPPQGPEGAYIKQVDVSSPASEAVRLTFNPSGRPAVDTLKALAAAFLTACDEVAAERPDAGRELAVAKTNMQTASMWAVLGATKGA